MDQARSKCVTASDTIEDVGVQVIGGLVDDPVFDTYSADAVERRRVNIAKGCRIDSGDEIAPLT